mmetsp:Transcript_25827/g.62018  ORF Transcript_25827/g.62018 Transcript_25827/m.62018 type:complete len:129 (+) Transcript_25827:51-437(+)
MRKCVCFLPTSRWYGLLFSSLDMKVALLPVPSPVPSLPCPDSFLLCNRMVLSYNLPTSDKNTQQTQTQMSYKGCMLFGNYMRSIKTTHFAILIYATNQDATKRKHAIKQTGKEAYSYVHFSKTNSTSQ